MITIEPFYQWEERQQFESLEYEQDCETCGGSGECECCGRDCLECFGSGVMNFEGLPEAEIHRRYFYEVTESLNRLCAFSSRHDFLDEMADFIKHHGRLDYHPLARQRFTRH